MSPRRLLAIAPAIIFMLLVICAGFMVFQDYHQSRLKIFGKAEDLTLSIANKTVANMEKAKLVLNRVAEDFPLLPTTPEARQHYADNLAKIAQSAKEIEGVVLLDARGTRIGRANENIFSNAGTLATDAFAHHRDHADMQARTGRPFSLPVKQRLVLPITRRINDSDGNLLGIVIVGLSLDNLKGEYANDYHLSDSRILLLDDAGNVLARFPANVSAVKDTYHTVSSTLTDHIDRQDSGQIDAPSPFDGVVRRHTFRHIDNAPLVIVLEESVEVQLTDWRTRTQWLLGYLALTLAILAAAGYYIDLLVRRGRTTQAALNEATAKAGSLEFALHRHAMVSRTDIKDRIIAANENFCKASGYSLDELLGKTHRLLNSGQHPAEFFADLHRTISAGEVWTGDICNKNKQGDFFWARSTIVPFRNAAGEVYQYVAVRTDISELKFIQRQIEIANESLAASFELLYATVNSSASGIVTTDKDGIIVMMNAAAEAMLGYSQQDAEGSMSILQLHDPSQVSGAILAAKGEVATDSRDRTYEALVAAVAVAPENEWTYLTASGDKLPVSLNISPLLDQRGILQGYVASFNDLTRLKQLEVMKSDFVSMVSHELRTPLTSIKGALSLLEKMAASGMPETQRRLLEIGVHNCEALINLVSDILDFDKISRKEMSYDMKVHDVRGLVEKAVAHTQPYAAQFNVSYWVDRHESDIPVLADAQRFEQVMMNLLSNAAKFSHPGSEVLVSAQADGGTVTISVTDKGVGIPEAFQPKIFQKFSQVNHADRPTKIKGTGLGLSIAKMIIEAHGGAIDFRSVEGVGTTFFIRLPLRHDHANQLEDNSHSAN